MAMEERASKAEIPYMVEMVGRVRVAKEVVESRREELRGARSLAKSPRMEMRAHRLIRLALLLLAFAVVVANGDSAGITCVGREPGYYADPGSQCHRWETISTW